MAMKRYSRVRKGWVEVSRLYPEDGFLLLNDDPEIWIQSNPADRLSSVRCLELDLWDYEGEAIGGSIGQFSELTHLFIREGRFLKSLPNTISRLHKLQRLEVRCCKLEELPANLGDLESLTSLFLNCLDDLKSLPDSVAKLSKLTSLSLSHCEKLEELPANLGDLEGLTLLSLNCLYYLKSLPDSVAKLSKLTSLSLSDCDKLEELPANLGDLQSLTSLFLEDLCNLKSLPDSVVKLSKLTSLSLSDCYGLEELPANLGDLESLTHLCLFGCRNLKSLPGSITKLSKLQFLQFPFESLIHALPSHLDDSLVIDYGYGCKTWKELKHLLIPFPVDETHFFSDILGELNEVDVKESTAENIIEKQAEHRPLSHVPDAIQISEDSYFPGRTDPINHNASSDSQNPQMDILPTGNTRQVPARNELEESHFHGGITAADENRPHALCSLQNQEIETLHSRFWDVMATLFQDIADESSSMLHETSNSSGENNHGAFENGQSDNIYLAMEQGIAPHDSINSVQSDSNYHDLQVRQDKNTQSDNVRRKTQKKEIPLERIRELISQNLRQEDAAEQHLGVSRSTLKRALKDYGITWPSSRKRKLQDSSNANQLTLLDHVPSGSNVVDNSTPDAAIRRVEEPPMSTYQCRMECVEEHLNGATESALLNTAQPGESCSTFVVKATYNEDTVRFDFSLSSSFKQLQDEVGKRFELEADKFKMYYQDDEKEWLLLGCIADLETALRFSKLSGSNIVRLSIKLKK